MNHRQDDPVLPSGTAEGPSPPPVAVDLPFEVEERSTRQGPYGAWTNDSNEQDAALDPRGPLETWTPPTRLWAMMRKRRPKRGLF